MCLVRKEPIKLVMINAQIIRSRWGTCWSLESVEVNTIIVTSWCLCSWIDFDCKNKLKYENYRAMNQVASFKNNYLNCSFIISNPRYSKQSLPQSFQTKKYVLYVRLPSDTIVCFTFITQITYLPPNTINKDLI